VISSVLATPLSTKLGIDPIELYNGKLKRKKMRKRIKESEPITENRRVIRIGNSFYLNLPPEFVIRNKIKAEISTYNL